MYENLGQYEKSLSFYEKALAITKEIGDRKREGYLYNSIGVAYDNLGQYEKSLSFYEKSLDTK